MGVLINTFIVRSGGSPVYYQKNDFGVPALIVLGIWVLANLGSFYVNFNLLWNLNPNYGSDICSHFRSKLDSIYNVYGETIQDDQTIKDYTARHFLSEARFGSVLGADRLSTIMQSIFSADFQRSKADLEGGIAHQTL